MHRSGSGANEAALKVVAAVAAERGTDAREARTHAMEIVSDNLGEGA